MTDPQPCRVIGVLDDGAASLSPTALALLRRADVVVGGSRTLTLLDDDIAPHAQRRAWLDCCGTRGRPNHRGAGHRRPAVPRHCQLPGIAPVH